jgi:hypothetical protein
LVAGDEAGLGGITSGFVVFVSAEHPLDTMKQGTRSSKPIKLRIPKTLQPYSGMLVTIPSAMLPIKIHSRYSMVVDMLRTEPSPKAELITPPACMLENLNGALQVTLVCQGVPDVGTDCIQWVIIPPVDA